MQTEQVSADLLATSVSKAVLAKEVLRLKQLRDELVTSTSHSPSALAERCKQLHLDIMEEEQRGAREIAELADQVRDIPLRAGTLQLLQRRQQQQQQPPPPSPRPRLGRSADRPSPRRCVLEQLAQARQELLDAREDAEESESGHGGWRLHSASHPRRDEKTAEGGGIGLKERARFDAAFMQKVVDVKRRLQDTSIEYATPLERSSGHIRGFLRSSNSRIQVVLDRIGTIRAQRELHAEVIELLRDNAALRVSVNDHAEGLLADTFDLLDEAPCASRMPLQV
jgi:hypothetical protein